MTIEITLQSGVRVTCPTPETAVIILRSISDDCGEHEESESELSASDGFPTYDADEERTAVRTVVPDATTVAGVVRVAVHAGNVRDIDELYEIVEDELKTTATRNVRNEVRRALEELESEGIIDRAGAQALTSWRKLKPW